MRQVMDWDNHWLDIARRMAHNRSKDPSTQVCCLLVRDNHLVVSGYNGFAPGAEETQDLWKRPGKYDRVIHAETNAVGIAARLGHPTDGCIAYVTHFPCKPCATALVAAGVIRVVVGEKVASMSEADFMASVTFFHNAGVEWELRS